MKRPAFWLNSARPSSWVAKASINWLPRPVLSAGSAASPVEFSISSIASCAPMLRRVTRTQGGPPSSEAPEYFSALVKASVARSDSGTA
ncbi:hypothetical protein D3C76_1657910 [compost metagenome]